MTRRCWRRRRARIRSCILWCITTRFTGTLWGICGRAGLCLRRRRDAAGRDAEMSRGIVCWLLLIGAVFFGVLALATLTPYPTKMVSDLGYYTLCPFAPWSTLTLLMLGG